MDQGRKAKAAGRTSEEWHAAQHADGLRERAASWAKVGTRQRQENPTKETWRGKAQ